MITTTFYGADSKVGCTMVTQVIAEELAKRLPEEKILVMHLDGTEGVEYISESTGNGIDMLKAAITADILNTEEIISICNVKKNLYTLKGTADRLERHVAFHPEMVEKLIKVAKQEFNYILIDAGSNIDSPLTMGSLITNLVDKKILITTQQKTALDSYILTETQIFDPLKITFDELVINKFAFCAGKFIETEKTISEKYGIENIFSIPLSEYGWQAEYEKCSLAVYKEKAYLRSIEKIVSTLYLPIIQKEKKKLISFFGK